MFWVPPTSDWDSGFCNSDIQATFTCIHAISSSDMVCRGEQTRIVMAAVRTDLTVVICGACSCQSVAAAHSPIKINTEKSNR